MTVAGIGVDAGSTTCKIVAVDASHGRTVWQRPLDVTDITVDDVAVLGRSGVACMVKDSVLR